MGILEQKLINAFSVLVYYNMIDSTKGKKLSEVPENLRNEVEIIANERYVNEYLSKVGESNGS